MPVDAVVCLFSRYPFSTPPGPDGPDVDLAFSRWLDQRFGCGRLQFNLGGCSSSSFPRTDFQHQWTFCLCCAFFLWILNYLGSISRLRSNVLCFLPVHLHRSCVDCSLCIAPPRSISICTLTSSPQSLSFLISFRGPPFPFSRLLKYFSPSFFHLPHASFPTSCRCSLPFRPFRNQFKPSLIFHIPRFLSFFSHCHSPVASLLVVSRLLSISSIVEKQPYKIIFCQLHLYLYIA